MKAFSKLWRTVAPIALALLTTVLPGRRAAADSPLSPLPLTSTTSPLAGLPFARDGKILHAGSWDRAGGNDDRRPIPPGKSLTLLDYHGAGIVRRFWVTIDPEQSPAINRGVVLRCYWDGETTPSVEVPIGDFFGAAFGKKVNYISLPQSITSGGMSSYWPMPFHRSARIVVDNESPDPVNSFYYNMEVETHKSLPRGVLHFHARWNRANPTPRHENYTILEARGRGHYVGTYLQMTSRGRGLGFLEGDEMVYVDGETKPSINGTGTEDFFNSGWYFDTGTFSAPYHGLILKEDTGRIAAYRWEIEDAVPFQKSIRFTIEHGDEDTERADYTSVAFWYQTEPHGPQPPLLPYAQRLPDYTPPPMPAVGDSAQVIGEDLADIARSPDGGITVQPMAQYKGGVWPGPQLFWHPKNGSELTVELPVQRAGSYELSLLMTRARDYGNVDILVNGNQVASFNGYTPPMNGQGEVANQLVPLGTLPLKAGTNTITFRVTGKDPASTNYLVGIGALNLQRKGD